MSPRPESASWVNSAGSKADGSVPPEVGSMSAWRGPAPSWFICRNVMSVMGVGIE